MNIPIEVTLEVQHCLSNKKERAYLTGREIAETIHRNNPSYDEKKLSVDIFHYLMRVTTHLRTWHGCLVTFRRLYDETLKDTKFCLNKLKTKENE